MVKNKNWKILIKSGGWIVKPVSGTDLIKVIKQVLPGA